jgi:serine/arginine repetitive matrix protein 2
MAEILMVRKKKSRAGLVDVGWGMEKGKEEKENVGLKVKNGDKEKDKWWSIGRGRRDSKEKAKDAVKPKSKCKFSFTLFQPFFKDLICRSLQRRTHYATDSIH